MSNTWGETIRVTLFGESHGTGIGAVIDGLPPGIAIDWERVKKEMARRAPEVPHWRHRERKRTVLLYCPDTLMGIPQVHRWPWKFGMKTSIPGIMEN